MSKKAIQHGKPIELPKEYDTLAGMMMATVENYPLKGITYVDASGKEDFESYPALVENARKYLKVLYRKGLKSGDIVILEIDNSKDFYRTFWACIFGGIIAAPVSQPTSWEPQSTGLLKFTKIWEVLNKPVVVVEEQLRARYQTLQEVSPYEQLRFISLNELSANPDEMEDIHWTQSEDIVFLQFSSGSTGIPKGVQLTNKNIITNTVSCKNGLGTQADEVAFTWLPHTHDMGLFGQHLTPVMSGSDIMVFSPYTFIRSPYIFLKKITEHRGKWFCCTNFGYDWMVQKVPDSKLSTLDLSSLRLTLNGAEPISATVIRNFTEKFSKCGFKPNMMFPAYGMAEATVGVSMPQIGGLPRFERIYRSKLTNENLAVPVKDADDEDCVEFVHEGYAADGISIRIADEQGNTLDENMIGEIQIKGDSVTSGYYNLEHVTKDLFIDGWLHTGDLGFMVDNGLIVSGRIKDIIFVRGQNFFAHDLEEVIYGLGTIPRGNIMLVGHFNSRTQQEELLVFVKHKSDVEKFLPIRQSIIDRLQESLGIETTHVIPIKLIPKTTSGKLQRFQLRKGFENGDFNDVINEIQMTLADSGHNERPINLPQNELEIFLHNTWSEILSIPTHRISIDDTFLSLGGNSIRAYQLLDLIGKHFDKEIGSEVLVFCKTIREIADYLQAMPSKNEESSKGWKTDNQLDIHKAVAITGLAVRLPNAKNQEEFWDNLASKKDSVSKISFKRRAQAGKPEWDDWLGELEEADKFDNEFFEISAEEAMFMDPQQRLLLEVSYEALEDAGVIAGSEDEKRNIGVYVGISPSTYYQLVVDHIEKNGLDHIHPNAMVGNMSNIGAALISHLYNFTGPALAIDTACSSFLVALHHAVSAIRQNQISGAVVGGANVVSTSIVHSLSRKAGICSSTNHTRVFDKNADGSVLGEGAVVVYLEPLIQAVKTNKNIYGVIRGTAINNDGYSLGIMAPNPKGQYQVLADAYADANLSPNEISYIEAHGSGTTIGDPIEISALTKLFSKPEPGDQPHIGIGSVKTNIGHLFPASSGASLAKVLLSMKNQKLAPSLHMEDVNPALQLEKTPLYVVKDLKDWSPKDEQTRKAGISSFGLGGTNAHIVLEEWNKSVVVPKEQRLNLLTLSAKTEKALESIISRTEILLKDSPDMDFNHLCFTRNRYRKHYSYRAACLISTAQDTNTLTHIGKGQFLKKRSAKVAVILGDLKSSYGGDNSVFKREADAAYQKYALEVSSTKMHAVMNDNQNTDEWIYLAYWHSFISKLQQTGVNITEMSGIGSGQVLADLLNGKSGEKNKSAKSNTADIVLGLGITEEDLLSILPDELKRKVKTVCLQPEGDTSFELNMLSVIGELYAAGADFDWEYIHPDGSGTMIHLPTYPFEQKAYWINETRGE
ncbi:beta-ketoacyl synthase N-terminal-like domain-containing protein [Paenibacillus wynnii]|uniref:Uncharacterized protein n=1 Tax=Paenibacillus wynnii TaxID=268407 RepID=A0A098M455_9BACL|nr:beta-ketoacyl synthase N-terminal-like domain-containing protein [Paenibacillus wynnii]KGE16337.1 hypothetical protein PWYN_16455 [Paenibacillus wynnii]